MKHLIYSATIATGILATSIPASAQTVFSDPVGYVTITCPSDSDTIVGTPLRQAAIFSGALSAEPSVNRRNSDLVTLTFNGTFTADLDQASYVQMTSGASEGKIFEVSASNGTTVTINLNGDSLTAASGDTLDIVPFWTLDNLFDPNDSTSDPATTGNAIVSSINTRNSGRRTEVALLDPNAEGTNLPPSDFYFIDQANSRWTKAGAVSDDFGDVKLWPDSYFIIRNPAAVSSATTYTSAGQVILGDVSIPLFTNQSGSQDNVVALPRPIDVTLDDLNLKDTPAFVSSTNVRTAGRRDTLSVFDNTEAIINKPPSATYFVLDGEWRRLGNKQVDAGTDVIPAGAGFLIRKVETETGGTVFWTNSRTFLNN